MHAVGMGEQWFQQAGEPGIEFAADDGLKPFNLDFAGQGLADPVLFIARDAKDEKLHDWIRFRIWFATRGSF